MSGGDQLRPLENRPYLDQWQKRMEAKPAKPVVKHKKGGPKVRVYVAGHKCSRSGERRVKP